MCHPAEIHGRSFNMLNWLVNPARLGVKCAVITNCRVTVVLPDWERKGYWQSTETCTSLCQVRVDNFEVFASARSLFLAHQGCYRVGKPHGGLDSR